MTTHPTNHAGNPTLIRHAIINDKMGMVITTMTARGFAARFQLYTAHPNGRTTFEESALYSRESGAIRHWEAWQEMARREKARREQPVDSNGNSGFAANQAAIDHRERHSDGGCCR